MACAPELAERPKLAPFVPAMRARLAALLGVDEARVGIEAKTMEGLGALAVVLLESLKRAAPARRSGR